MCDKKKLNIYFSIFTMRKGFVNKWGRVGVSISSISPIIQWESPILDITIYFIIRFEVNLYSWIIIKSISNKNRTYTLLSWRKRFQSGTKFISSLFK